MKNVLIFAYSTLLFVSKIVELIRIAIQAAREMRFLVSQVRKI